MILRRIRLSLASFGLSLILALLAAASAFAGTSPPSWP